MQEPKQFEGFVLFVLMNEGTKSERLAPLLIRGGGSTILLHLEGDHSFEGVKLRPYHKKYCKLSGYLNTDRMSMKVTEIEIADDPLETILQHARKDFKEDNQTQQQNDE